MGALHRQRGDRSNIYFSRAAFMMSVATSLYLVSLLHVILKERFEILSSFLGETVFSFEKYHGSTLLAIIFALLLIITFYLIYYPNIVSDFKANRHKKWRYSIFLLYFFGSFVAYLFSMGYMLDDL
jgi:hypothetical protein